MVPHSTSLVAGIFRECRGGLRAEVPWPQEEVMGALGHLGSCSRQNPSNSWHHLGQPFLSKSGSHWCRHGPPSSGLNTRTEEDTRWHRVGYGVWEQSYRPQSSARVAGDGSRTSMASR